MNRNHRGNPTAVYIMYAVITLISWLLFGDILGAVFSGTGGLILMGIIILPSTVRGLGKEWAKGIQDAAHPD